MPLTDGEIVAKAIEKHAREVKHLVTAVERLAPRSTTVNQLIQTPETEEKQVEPEEPKKEFEWTIHRAEEWTRGHIFKPACRDLIGFDHTTLIVSTNEDAINCITCKSIK